MLKHHVFLLHGITDNTNVDKDYKEFCNKLRKEFKAKYKSELDEHIELIPIKWEKVVGPAEQALYEKCFGKVRQSDKVLVSSILNPIDQATGLVSAMTHTPDALQVVTSRWQSWRGWRYFATMFMGDVIAYVDDNDNGIRREVWNTIREYLDKHDVPPFSIIGHGIGSVIAYDLLYALLKSDGPNLYAWGEHTADHKNKNLLEKIRKSFRNFYSVGSPITLFLLRKHELWKGSNGHPPEFKNVVNPFAGTRHKWLNFVDTDDVAAYPVEQIFNGENNLDKPANPRDVFVQTGWLPPFAHINYWRNKTVAEEISKHLNPEISVTEKERELASAAR